MSAPTAGPEDEAARLDGAFRIVVVLALGLLVLSGVRLVAWGDPPREALGVPGTPSATPSAATPASGPVDVAAYLDADPRPAPDLELRGPAGPLSLAAMRGRPVLVFFGYTHCPDVCPATIGTVGLAIDAYAGDAEAVFVSVDPERDTPDWLAEFVRFMPTGFRAVSGTPAEVRATADAWGVRYARVDTDQPGVYTMAHTADVFVVDRGGALRARLPFGTDAPTMTAVLAAIDDLPPVAGSAAPSASARSTAPATALNPVLVSSSVWSGGRSPVIFRLDGDAPTSSLEAVVLATDGVPVGDPAPVVAVRPEGVPEVSYVATLDIPAPGAWRVEVRSAAGVGAMDLTALDPGGTAALGAAAPVARTAIAADAESLSWLTTDPLPDPRLYRTTPADALAAGQPFVFVVDSYRFKVTQQCGQAVVMAKQLLDRWTAVPFIHHEPLRYSIVTTEPVLEGTLENPRFTDVATAWGVGDGADGMKSMPWIFVVDRHGMVRAKYYGVIGSADVDVILTQLAEEDRTALWPLQEGPLAPVAAPDWTARVVE
jgi:protein SCO1/2